MLVDEDDDDAIVKDVNADEVSISSVSNRTSSRDAAMVL